MFFSYILPLVVLFVGVYLLFKLKFFFLRHPIRTFLSFADSLKDKNDRRALFLALAGTLGVGNIFGVASGIIYGGAGSVLWLALSSLFASVLKYSECVLSIDTLEDGIGGMHIVILKTFKRRGRPLSRLYAVACIMIALFMGGAMQSSAAVGAYTSLSQKSLLLPSIVFALLVLIGVLGGGEKISKVTEKVIPLTMIVYILLCFIAIFGNFSSLDNALLMITEDALNPRAATAGIGMHLFLTQFSEGFCRGILSNEAGCGTSSFAHSRSSGRTPYSAGLSGMCEVFFDTSVLCILTALAILCSVSDPQSYTSPMALVSDAVGKSLGGFSGVLLLLSVTAFAYSTVICWFYYGSVTSAYLAPRFGARAFALVFFAFLIFGVNIPSRTLIEATDALLLVLCVLTVAAILRGRDRIRDLTLN